MVYVFIVGGFFSVCATIAVIGAAVAPGGFRHNIGQALAVCVGAPLAIGVAGTIAGLVWALFKAVS